MPDLGAPVTDPDLLQQLEGTTPQPKLGPAVDAMTAKFLDQLPSQNGQADVQEGMPSLATNLFYGMRQPIDQAATLLAKLFPSQAPSVAAANQSAQQAYEKSKFPGPVGTAAELAGNMIGTAPIAAAIGPEAFGASLPARIGASAAMGAGSGALQPVDPNDPEFWSKTGKNALFGAGVGAAVPPVLGAASRVISPNISPDVRTLRNAGVNMTPGQIMGGTANRLEEAAQSLPVAGDFIRNARRGAVVDFNREAINQALAPIGETLEAQPGTREAIGEMQDKIGKAYKQIVPQLGWQTRSPSAQALVPIGQAGAAGAAPDAATTFQNGLQSLSAAVRQGMPAKYADEFDQNIKLLVDARLSPGGGITGQSFQAAKSDLGKLAIGQNTPASNFWDRALGSAYLQAQQVMRDAQGVADPAVATAYQNVDNAFAHSLRVNNAAARMGAEPGLFSPAQLDAATKAMDPSMRKNAFAAGDALMQNYAEAGKSVLGNRLPDSGTPYRSALRLGAAGTMAALGGHAAEGLPMVGPLAEFAPAALGAYGALSAGTGLAYSPFTRRAIGAALASRPGFAQPLAQAIRGATPGAALGLPWALSGQ